jgi:hypothetical protein
MTEYILIDDLIGIICDYLVETERLHHPYTHYEYVLIINPKDYKHRIQHFNKLMCDYKNDNWKNTGSAIHIVNLIKNNCINMLKYLVDEKIIDCLYFLISECIYQEKPEIIKFLTNFKN